MSEIRTLEIEGTGEISVSTYGDPEVKRIAFRPDGGVIPIKVGETFTCTVTAITRESVER